MYFANTVISAYIIIDSLFALTIDYDSAGYSVIIGSGETEGSQNITIAMDSISGEGDETFTNRIQSVSTPGVTLGERESVVTIRDSTGNYI